jgi:hypothetical protein
MQPSCPRGTELLNSYTSCGYSCETGYVILSIDDSYCVGSHCPPSSTIDTSNNSLCWKISIPKNGPCPDGYTAWTPTACYADCPVGFRENGQSCILPTIKRKIILPTCPYLFNLIGDTCQPSNFIYFLIIVLVLLLMYYRYNSCRL